MRIGSLAFAALLALCGASLGEEMENDWARQARPFDGGRVVSAPTVSARSGIALRAAPISIRPVKARAAVAPPGPSCAKSNRTMAEKIGLRAAAGVSHAVGMLVGAIALAAGAAFAASIFGPVILAGPDDFEGTTYGERLGKMFSAPIALPIRGYKWGRKVGLEAAYGLAHAVRAARGENYIPDLPPDTRRDIQDLRDRYERGEFDKPEFRERLKRLLGLN